MYFYQIVKKLKEIAETGKKSAEKNNNKKGGARKVSTPKGKTKMAIKEKGEKKDFSKTLTTKKFSGFSIKVKEAAFCAYFMEL